MKKINKILSIFLVCVIIFMSFPLNIPVYASATERQSTFLNFYQDSGASILDSKNLNVEDYYVLAVFMSNYYEPGVTKMSEMTSGVEEGFLKNFVTALGYDMGDGFGSKMKEISMLISKDIQSAIESGVCTITDKDGKIISGRQVLEKMIAVVGSDSFSSNADNKLYYKDSSGRQVAFDFAAPATHAAFEVLSAYNPDMFLNKKGIESIDALFIDHIGNLWGVEAGDRADDLQKSNNLTGLITSLGADKVYLIMPACLNPSTFSKGIKEAENLKMPLMNRYTLSCIASKEAFMNAEKNMPWITAYNIPFYNAFAEQYLGSFSNENEGGLMIYGVNSLSNNLLNVSKGGYNESNVAYNLAQYLYNPDAIAIRKKNKEPGIGEFGTNSYIVFSPNPDSLFNVGGDGGQYHEGHQNNKNIDMATGFIKTDYFAFDALRVGVGTANEDEKAGIKNQQKLLTYLYTPIALNLNQVSMSFYLSVGESAAGNDEEGASETMARSLYSTSSEEDEIASKMGMRGFDLFFKSNSSSVELSNSHGDSEEYASMSPDNVIRSKVMERILSSTNVEQDGDVYNAIKNKKVNWMDEGYFDTNSSDYKNVKNMLTCLMEVKVSDDIINSFDLRYFIYIKQKDSTEFKGRGDTGLNYADDKKTYNESKYQVDATYQTEKVYRWYIHPKGMLTAGSAYDGSKDLPYCKTLGIGDSTIRSKLDDNGTDVDITNQSIDAQYVEFRTSATDKESGDEKTLGEKNTENLVDYIAGYFCYEIFTPSSAVVTACSSTTPSNVGKKLFGSDKDINSQLKVSDFGNNSAFIMGIYFGYILDMMGIDSIDSTGLSFGLFDSVFLPNSPISAKGNQEYSSEDGDGDGVVNPEDLSFEEKQKDLINRIYGLTNDSNNDYRNNLIKNILEGLFLTIHRTITGTWYSNIDTVTTGSSNTYQSVTGYIYTPTLEELSFTATLMNNYVQIYIFCLMIVFFFLILLVLLNQRTWQQGVIVACIMSVAMLFPYVLISNTINISNKISDSIYSDRFDFWAISEHQQRQTTLVGVDSLSDKDRLLTISNASADLTNTGNAGVKIKWMSPKKVDMFQTLYSDTSLSESFVTNMEIFKWLFSSFIYDSEFVDTDVYGSYLYRPYNSIALEADCYYQWMKELIENSDYNSNSVLDYNDGVISYQFKNIPTLFYNTVNTISTSTTNNNTLLAGLARIDKEYYINANGSKLSYSQEKIDNLRLLSQKDPKSVYEKADKIGLMGCLSQEVTQRFNEDVSIASSFGVVSNLPSINEGNYFTGKDARQISKALYLKNTESPYYYFYSVLKYRYSENSEHNTFKKELIENNLFKISHEEEALITSGRDVSGMFRDFLDLEGLFTYIIPYMSMSNEYVKSYQSIYGTTVEEYNFEYKTNEDTGDVTEIVGGEDYRSQVESKNNMNKVWNMYCPWVDSLYDLNVLNKKVSVGGKTLQIPDTLNPSSYISSGRPMIFSEADMVEKGYSFKDLTDIERRIQSVTEKTYNDLLYLVNYYDMDDEVLISAAAMYATFNFNTEFSKDSFMGKSVMLYPQGFELKNFNYDAFMRLALLNSTGESVFATEDLYARVLTKTSIFTGLLLIICDFIACILIPLFKFIIIIGLLFLGLLICITCVINPPEKIFEAVNKSLLLPTVLFMVLNIGFAWCMSFIVGEGLTAYVGSKGVNFATNDPTITMLIMALLGCTYVFFSWKVLKLLISAYKKFGMSTMLAAVGTVGAAIAGGTKGIANKAAKLTGRTVRGVGRGASAIGGAVVGAAGAEKGKRLAGAFEGGSNGLKGAIKQRIRDNKRQEQMSKQNDDLAEKLDILSKRNKNDNNDNNNGAHQKPPEGIVPAGGVNPDNRTPEEKEEARRKAEEAMAEAKKRKELDKWKEDREYEKLEKQKERWDREQENKQKAQENANSNRKKREQQQKAHNDNKARKGNSKKKKGKKKGKKK